MPDRVFFVRTGNLRQVDAAPPEHEYEGRGVLGRGVDVVIENVGAAVWSSAMKSLVRGGRLVTCGATSGDQPPADIRRIFIRQLQILGSTMGDLGDFGDLLSLVQRRGLKPVIDSQFALKEVHSALDRLESGQQFGKVVINIGSAC